MTYQDQFRKCVEMHCLRKDITLVRSFGPSVWLCCLDVSEYQLYHIAFGEYGTTMDNAAKQFVDWMYDYFMEGKSRKHPKWLNSDQARALLPDLP